MGARLKKVGQMRLACKELEKCRFGAWPPPSLPPDIERCDEKPLSAISYPYTHYYQSLWKQFVRFNGLHILLIVAYDIYLPMYNMFSMFNSNLMSEPNIGEEISEGCWHFSEW